MNIFILDPNPVIAAQMHCDQHLNKMILESAQMLSTALHKINSQNGIKLIELDGIYKPAYQEHPCTKWCSESYANFLWVLDLAYTLQSQLHKLHKATGVIKSCEKHARFVRAHFPSQELTPFALAMPEEIKFSPRFPNAVSKYHEWYKYKALDWKIQGRFMTYSQFGQRKIPDFIRPTLNRINREGI